MQLPGTASLIFLVYLLGVLSWAGIRSARRLRDARASDAVEPLPSRQAIWIGTLASQSVLLVLAWLTGRGFDYRIFALPSLGAREIGAALVALAAFFGLRAISRALRSEEERRAMTVYRLAPRTASEWSAWTTTVLVASVAEEAGYRGVGMAILGYSLGDPWLAALISATAFALAHWTQGGKSAVVIFAMALVMHGLVAFTGTLILAMAVHAVYDFVAGYRIALEARRFEEQEARR
jgi:membrane protease YdiL (CAAX protease family)